MQNAVAYGNGTTESALVLRPEQREQLEGKASSRSFPAGLVSRARIILLSASSKTNLQIARHTGLTNVTVGKWRQRFLEQDVFGLHDELRPGRPRPIGRELENVSVGVALARKPARCGARLISTPASLRRSAGVPNFVLKPYGVLPSIG